MELEITFEYQYKILKNIYGNLNANVDHSWINYAGILV